MRLTLRTLLSYLDNVLEEPARTELHRQIEASEHAKEWVHRTRDVMRRLKLGAPEPGGSGAVDDPNTVAEYLDRGLPEQDVAQFERVCLESDQLLAEVASCHHVLAKVLTEPMEIDPDTRQRLHDLPAALAREAAAKPAVEAVERPTPATPADLAPARRRVKPSAIGAPADERDGAGWASWAPAIAALLLLAVTAVLLLRPKSDEVVKPNPSDPTPTSPTPAEELASVAPESPPAEGVANADPTTGADPVAPEAANAASTPTAASPEPGAATSGVAPAQVDPPSQRAAPEPTPPTPDASAADDAANLPGGATAEEPPVDEAPPAEEGAAPPAGADAGGPAPDAAADTPPPPVTRFLGDLRNPRNDMSVVVSQRTDGAWARLRAGDSTPDVARVVALPTTRGVVQVAERVLVELVGETDVRVDPRGPTVELLYGRAIFSTPPDSKDDAMFRVELDGESHEATLAPGAAMAVAADRFHQPGSETLTGSPPLAYAVSALGGGEVTWKSGTGVETHSQPKESFDDQNLDLAPSGFKTLAWVEALPLSAPDAQAGPRLATWMRSDQAPEALLREVAADPEGFPEDRSLAARSLLALGDGAALVASFRDPEFSKHWRTHLDAARAASARGTDGARVVFSAFEGKFDRNVGASLFDATKGFSAAAIGADGEEFAAGPAVARLLELLESPELADRVLGKLLLEEVAVLPADVVFDPAGSTTLRSRFIRILKGQLGRGQITPRPQAAP